jgi:hypothetical protein
MFFGNPRWFRQAPGGRGLRPAGWQGWLCLLTWIAILVLPFGVLIGAGRVPESFVWFLVVSGCLFWETRQIRQQLQRAARGDDVLYIGEEGEPDQLATRNYDFRLRR